MILIIWINETPMKKIIQALLLECISFGVRRWLKRKTTHQHLYLPKDYSGSPTASIYTPWTESEVHSHLATGWGEGAITELKLEYLYGPEPEV
jgi:hypothetical protein